MNFDDAIRSHSDWKLKLALYLERPDGSLSPAIVEFAEGCALGKWLHGDGSVHATRPEYATLMEAHVRFHQVAAEVVRRADAGEKLAGEVLLGLKGTYGKASIRVVRALMDLRDATSSR